MFGPWGAAARFAHTWIRQYYHHSGYHFNVLIMLLSIQCAYNCYSYAFDLQEMLRSPP